MKTFTITMSCLALLAAATACGGDDKKPARSFTVSAARKEANDVFASLCSTCHGVSGKGDGPGAAACDPKPRAFGDPSWQTSVTDEHIQKTIVYGGAAVGRSPQMPAQPQLKGKQELLDNLVAIVRGFGSQ